MSPDQRLLEYNQRGALTNILAVEEHLAQLPPGVRTSWCAKKHSLLACDHHLTEAVNHASRIDPELARRCRALKARAEAVLKPGDRTYLPALGDVAKLRNELRSAFKDPTLGTGCNTCRQDGLGAAPTPRRGVGLVVAAALAWLILR